MTRRKRLIGLTLIALVGLAAWFGWRWYTTPPAPNVPLGGVSREKAERIERAQEAVRRDRRSGPAWGALGLTLLANGFPEESVPCFAHAERFDPADPRWPYYLGTQSITFGRREGFDKIRAALTVARSARERKAVLVPLAQALVEDGQLDGAERCARQLGAVAPDGAEADYAFGLLAVARGDRAAAREHLGRLTRHPSARKRAYALLAGLTDGNQELAQNYRRRANELPEDQLWPDAFENELAGYTTTPSQRLAPYFELEAQGRHEEALTFLRELVQRSPDESSCLTLGFALFALNRFEEAAPVFRQALGFNPRNARGHLLLGACLLQTGERRLLEGADKEKALELLREAVATEDTALALQNDNADAHLTRGRALKRLGRTDDAIAALREAVRTGSEYAEMHQALGEALAEAGQVREGLEHLEDAARLAKPNEPGPRQALEKWKGKDKPKP